MSWKNVTHTDEIATTLDGGNFCTKNLLKIFQSFVKRSTVKLPETSELEPFEASSKSLKGTIVLLQGTLKGSNFSFLSSLT